MSGERRLALYRGVWCLYWRDGRNKPRRRSLGTKDRAEAERRKRNLELALNETKTGPLIGGIIKAYLEHREGGGANEKNRRYAWKAASKTFDHLEPHHVTYDLCREFTKARREAGSSDGTIIKQLGLLRAALRWQDPNTPAKIEMPPQPDPKDRHLTRDEAAALIRACTAPHVRLFVILALSTAARASALLELRWDQIDFDRGYINLGRGARNKRRGNPPMNDMARTALVAAREAAVSDYVIEYAGKKVGSVKRGFASACERAGLEDVSPHVLRHSAAVWMVEAGWPMSEVSQYLGHTSTSVTERVYARFSPDHLRGAASALEVQWDKRELPASNVKSLKRLADP